MDAAHVATDKEIELLQRQILSVYTQAEKQINTELQRWAKSVKETADKLLKAVKDAGTDTERKAAENAYKQFFIRAVKKDKQLIKASQNASRTLYNANVEAQRIINSRTAQIYAENYNSIGRQAQRNLRGYKFQPVTEDDAKKYGEITTPSVDRKKDESWNAKNIAGSVVAAALMLWSVDKIVKHSASLTAKKNYDGGKRQASDTLTDAENKGRLDSMWRVYDEGFENVKKEWVCIFDNRTRETHIEYNDLGAVELDYEYAPGLARPKDPHCSDMSEVCNCRCALTTNFGLSKGQTRAARWYSEGADRSGFENLVSGSYKKPSSFKNTQTEQVSRMTYKEWMEWRKSR